MVEEMEAEKPSFFDRIRGYFSKEEEEEGNETYQRNLLDSRIEKFLDHHAAQYISEFGLVTSIDIQGYEERYEDMTVRINSLQDFARDADAEVSNLENRMEAIKLASKGKKK
jgi:hypothetical protein